MALPNLDRSRAPAAGTLYCEPGRTSRSNPAEFRSQLGAVQMSVRYQAIFWNPTKRVYDSFIAAGVFLYLGTFVGLGALVHPNATIETLLIRGFGTLALLLLHKILCIGPL